MAHIKAFDLTLTAAAFAALVFLLPADRDSANTHSNKSQTPISHQGNSQTSHQQPVRGGVIHNT